MKITLDEFWTSIKTKVEQSVIIEDLWIARSAIEIHISNKVIPVFGFASAFDKDSCVMRANYELLEHAVFLPYLHNVASANKPVTFLHEKLNFNRKKFVKDYLIGSSDYYGNGCAVSNDKQFALMHAMRELLERHLCCEIWYKGKYALHQVYNSDVNFENHNILIKFFTINMMSDDKFIISVLDCVETGFFGLGAAIKSDIEAATMHALTEVLMLFEDAKRNRQGFSSNEQSKQKLLSLRNNITSLQRKRHFEKILSESSFRKSFFDPPKCQSIIFEPFENIFAVRSFSTKACDPRIFEKANGIPILPLF